MKTSSTLIIVSVLAAALQAAAAADITGTITLKGTPPKEKEITPVMDDANCSKMHTTVPTTHFYVVGAKGELADVIVSLQGISGKSTGASAPPVTLDQKGCEYVPSIFAVQTGQKIIVRNSDPVLHNVHTMPTEDSGNPVKNEAQLPNGPDLTFSFSKPENFLKFKCDVHRGCSPGAASSIIPISPSRARMARLRSPTCRPANTRFRPPIAKRAS